MVSIDAWLNSPSLTAAYWPALYFIDAQGRIRSHQFGEGGKLAYRFHARDAHLVMGRAGPAKPVRFRVRIDGQPPGPSHGA